MIDEGKIKEVGELPVYFAKEVGQMVKDRGFSTLQAWEDGLKYASGAKEFATDNTRVNFWETLYWGGFNEAMKWAHKGYQVVLSNPDYLYFDFPNEVHPAERGYYWATRFNDTRKVFAFAPENLPQNAETSVDRDGNAFVAKGDQDPVKFKGISGQQWSETVRTDAQYEYMVYPRTLLRGRACLAQRWLRAELCEGSRVLRRDQVRQQGHPQQRVEPVCQRTGSARAAETGSGRC